MITYLKSINDCFTCFHVLELIYYNHLRGKLDNQHRN